MQIAMGVYHRTVRRHYRRENISVPMLAQDLGVTRLRTLGIFVLPWFSALCTFFCSIFPSEVKFKDEEVFLAL